MLPLMLESFEVVCRFAQIELKENGQPNIIYNVVK